jgi:gas vesicle protein GvpK
MSANGELVDKLLDADGDLRRIAGELDHLPEAFPRRVNADPEQVEKGLAQLVLTLVELLRQLMERQALRRMDTGTLTDEEIERLGDTFMKLDRRMRELTEHFGLEEGDLNLNLGPLGDLL